MDVPSQIVVLAGNREDLETQLDAIDRHARATIQQDRRATLRLQIEEIDREVVLLGNSGSAQDARSGTSIIQSQIPAAEWLQCILCTESKPTTEVRRLECDEAHIYCDTCLVQWFDRATSVDEDSYPPRCCTVAIPVDADMIHVIGGGLAQKYADKGVELATLDRTYCSNADCARFIMPDTIVDNVATCPAPNCGRATCTRCKSREHGTDPCPDDPSQAEVRRMGTEQGWRACPTCGHLISLRSGCNHITCRCFTQFCYECGVIWKNCRCNQWHEPRLYERADQVINRNVRREEAHNDPEIAHLAPARPGAPPAAAPPAVPQFGSMLERLGIGGARRRADNVPVPQPMDARRRQADILRQHHECEHSRRWRGVDPLEGGEQCELCFRNTHDRMKECRRCFLLVCERCRRNRIRNQRTVDVN